MNKRMWALLLAFLMVLGVLASCAGNVPGGETGKESVTSATESGTEQATENGTEQVTENGTEQVTETTTEAETEAGSATETETETESETESKIEPVTEQEAACHTLRYSINDRGRMQEHRVYYRSLRDAIAANPDGADIWITRKVSEADLGVQFPDGADFSLHTTLYEYDFAEYYKTGAVYEYAEYYFIERAYFTSLDACLSYFSDEYADFKLPLELRSIWILSETEQYETGKYYVTAGEDGFVLEKECDLTYWSYTPLFSEGTHVFYTNEQVIAYLKKNPTIRTIHVINSLKTDEVFDVPYELSLRIQYDHNRVDMSFSYGMTFDDGTDGLCYYNDFSLLSSNPQIIERDKDGNIISGMYIWSEDEGFLPGKYKIVDGCDMEETFDEETGCYTLIHLNALNVSLVWVDTIDAYARDHLSSPEVES